MPQMAPISWLVLFLVFSITLILFNILNYYCVLPKSISSEEKKAGVFSNSLNWKW
nr:ATP synthase F0 subunit 8 [Pseudodiamesa sp. 2XL]